MKVPKTNEGICGLHALNFDYFFRHDSVRTPLVDEGFQKLRRTPRRSASSPCVRSAPTITPKLSRRRLLRESTEAQLVLQPDQVSPVVPLNEKAAVSPAAPARQARV